MKRITVMLIILVLTLGVCSLPAAAETGVSTMDELVTALENGGTVVLAADIELIGYIDIQADTVLDLNGHTLSAAEENYSASLLSRYEQNVVIRDSAGGGAIQAENAYVSLSVERGTLTVESGHIQNLHASGGDVTLSGGTIGEVQFDSFGSALSVTKGEATVSRWRCGQGTVNFDPTEYIRLGYKAVNNGDGTYTIDTVTVEKTGETITVFYNGYDEENNRFHISADGQVPDELVVEIPIVNDGEPETIPMTKCDEDGMLWEAHIDKAYIGAEMCFANKVDGISTAITTVPEKSGMTFNSSNKWNTPPSEETPDEDSSDKTTEKDPDETSSSPSLSIKSPGIWVWLIPLAAAALIVAVVIVLLLRKKTY